MVEKFQKHVSFFEKATAIVVGLLLLACIITQFFFDGDVLRLMVVLAACELVFSYLAFWPETYELREDSLSIVAAKRRQRANIPYDTIVDIDTVGTFRASKKDFDTVEIILTFVPRGKRRARSVSCHPKDSHRFVAGLRARCPNLIGEDTADV